MLYKITKPQRGFSDAGSVVDTKVEILTRVGFKKTFPFFYTYKVKRSSELRIYYEWYYDEWYPPAWYRRGAWYYTDEVMD